MLKKSLVLVGVAVAVGLLTMALFRLFSGGPESTLEPIKPPPGEELRLQPKAPAPAAADPAEVARGLEGKVLLPGDVVLAEALKSALAAGEKPTYKVSVDVPLEDNAAQAVRDEFRAWLGKKMASFGFQEASGKPSISWIVHIDPVEGVVYSIETTLRAGGTERFSREYELPNAYSPTRMEKTLAADFAP
jgi:hypothetical protein